MVWFRVDDGFPRSRKVLSIPKKRRVTAVGVWLLAGAWSAGELTDGFVPNFALDEIPNGFSHAPDLVSARLWDEVDGGFQFHDWHHYQPSKDAVLKERADHAARQKAYRDRKQAERDARRDASQDASVPPAVTTARPDPTRPDPTVLPTEVLEELPLTHARKNRGTRLPDNWMPSTEDVAWARTECPAVDTRAETEQFRDWFKAAPNAKGVKLDWTATWRNWMRNEQKKSAQTRGYSKPTPVIYEARRGQMAREA